MRFRYLLYFLLLLPVVILRDYTPDNELKYISIAQEALDNGTFVTFYNHGEAYADKPPLFFWLIMLTKTVTGGFPMWIVGLFSLLPALGILAIMDRWMRRSRLNHNPIVSNLMLVTTVMFLGSALVVRMDMLMTLFIVLSLDTFFRLYTSDQRRPRGRWLLPVWIFLAVFTKGPMGLIIPMLSIIGFLIVKGQLKSFGRYMGWRQWAILLLLCGAWFSAVYLEGGMEYLNNILFKQTVGRGIDSFHHKEPVWFYFPRMLWSFAPWVLLFVVSIWRGARKKILSDTEKFFATIIVVNVVMLSLVSSKIDIYMLPIYPFVVYLAAAMLPKYRPGGIEKIALALPSAIFMLIFPVSFFVTDMIPYGLAGNTFLVAGMLVISLGGLAGLVFSVKGELYKSAISIASGLLGMIFIVSFAVPRANEYIGLEITAEKAQATAAARAVGGYAYYRHHDLADMDVYLGQKLAPLEDIPALSAVDRSGNATVVFVREKDVRRRDDLREWLDGRAPAGVAGNYMWFVLGGRAESDETAVME